MNINDHLITCDDDNTTLSSKKMVFSSLQELDSFWAAETNFDEGFLEKLIFQVARKPKNLVAHIQRIYYCFHMQLDDPLFAALVDFLTVLNKQGQAISWRMVLGAKSRLSSTQFNVFNNYLKNANAETSQLPGNQFSVFSKGLVGVDSVIQQAGGHDVRADGIDPIVLARDYIEYSQLDEAKQVLEDAILIQPARLDLHHELLSIYRSMRDQGGFNQMLAELTQLGGSLPDEWEELRGYFQGLNNNE
ncbi:MAG: hypothetical protein NTV43_06660 [Methylococcales bacterium]|nr:hypothetical protein [Methylococcales bacterium]